MPDEYELARCGDPDAMRSITANLRPRLVRMAAYYARRTGQDADDLLQEAWCGLLSALPEMDPTIGSPRQYLISRARWRMLDCVRREQLRRCQPFDSRTAPIEDAPDVNAVDAVAVGMFMEGLNAYQRALTRLLLDGLTWR